MRILRPAGRLLVVHDYGRDDVTRLLGDRGARGQLIGLESTERAVPGPTASSIRVLHCWWRWETLDEAAALLRDAFGAAGGARGRHAPPAPELQGRGLPPRSRARRSTPVVAA